MYLNFNAIRLTIHTVLKMDDGMKIVDETGRVHDLSVATVRTMIGTGWGAFIAAWLLNIAFYKVQYVVNPSIYYFVFLSGSSVCSGLGGQQVQEQNGDQCSWRAEEDHEGCQGRR